MLVRDMDERLAAEGAYVCNRGFDSGIGLVWSNVVTERSRGRAVEDVDRVFRCFSLVH